PVRSEDPVNPPVSAPTLLGRLWPSEPPPVRSPTRKNYAEKTCGVSTYWLLHCRMARCLRFHGFTFCRHGLISQESDKLGPADVRAFPEPPADEPGPLHFSDSPPAEAQFARKSP